MPDRAAAITFSPFRLDLCSGQLLQGNQPIPLRPKTWSVLHYLAERPGVLMSVMRTLSVHRRCTELPLSDLCEEEVVRYLQARFAHSDFAPALARLIHQQTDGNPLFMVGVVDHLQSRGDILDTAPGWALRAPLAKLDLGVPDDVRLLIENDLDDLSPADRALLQAASVAGDAFTALVVAAALGCEVADVEMRCEAFARAQRFLRVAGPVEWPDHSVAQRYAFAHELYRQAVYAQIADGQCMRLHQRVGQALEGAYGAQRMEIAPQLATHFERGRDDARALRYLTAAAGRARLRFAGREAMGYLEAALAVVTRLPDDDERRRQELELRLSLGVVLSDLYGFGSELVRENYLRAAELCAAVGSGAQLFSVLYARWYLHWMRAERNETLALTAQLERLARRRLGTAQHRVVAASVLVRAAVYDGRFAGATRLMQRRLARLHSPKGAAAAPFGPDPLFAATMHSASALWFLGHPARAQSVARTAVARARTFDPFFTLVAVLMQAALVDLLCRDSATGGELADESMSLSAEHGFAFRHAVASVLRGWALVQQDRAAEGNAAIAAALAGMQATGARFFSAFGDAFLAEGHLRGGTLADGFAAIDAGLAGGRVEPRPRLRAGALAPQGRAGAERSRQSRVQSSRRARDRTVNSRLLTVNSKGAEACLQRALKLARAAQAKSLELRAATSLGRVWQARGRTGDARRLLGGVCKWFPARATTADLVEARTLLRELTSGLR